MAARQNRDYEDEDWNDGYDYDSNDKKYTKSHISYNDSSSIPEGRSEYDEQNNRPSQKYRENKQNDYHRNPKSHEQLDSYKLNSGNYYYNNDKNSYPKFQNQEYEGKHSKVYPNSSLYQKSQLKDASQQVYSNQKDLNEDFNFTKFKDNFYHRNNRARKVNESEQPEIYNKNKVYESLKIKPEGEDYYSKGQTEKKVEQYGQSNYKDNLNDTAYSSYEPDRSYKQKQYYNNNKYIQEQYDNSGNGYNRRFYNGNYRKGENDSRGFENSSKRPYHNYQYSKGNHEREENQGNQDGKVWKDKFQEVDKFFQKEYETKQVNTNTYYTNNPKTSHPNDYGKDSAYY